MAPLYHASGRSEPHINTRNNVALGMIGGAFVGIMALTTPFVAMQLRSSLPYMATPRDKVERALRFISQRTATASNKNSLKSSPTQQLTKKKGNQLNFVDLGSGDGTAILAAASLGWNATGLELNPTLWFVSSLRRLFSHRTIRTNSQLVMGDMFQNETAKKRLRVANCVMIFGVQPLMPKIADLVQRECHPGCFLMSYRFRVPLLTNATSDVKKNADTIRDQDDVAKASSSSGIDATVIYDKEDMRIYELKRQ
mmetsp:Transcript_37135/g.80168  ORF Transcript_37135/g.80168 Transcript_37135/m.80168 type:complete len:254 (+) Transcript_37135:315-1076(+)